MTYDKLRLDPIHSDIADTIQVPIINDVWDLKYKWEGENNVAESLRRAVEGVYAKDKIPAAKDAMLQLVDAGLWMPGGRIIAGAGTSKVVTLMNCYVNETLEDSMQGIHRAIGNTMFTLQQGGGIGTDFSTLRPKGASLKRTGPGSAASGPLPFMAQWDATSMTIKSAGDRRGAMMGTISDTHPDLPDFIEAKHDPLALRQFNVSVLVSDSFMAAVKADAPWDLYFPHEPAVEREEWLVERDFEIDGVKQYVYDVWDARDLWDKIMKSTYDYAEPGVIFIDRINALNNLNYCETIRCTNPCGEQPLPPNGTCNLGAVNLARLVKNPFTPEAELDSELLVRVVTHGVRFLDNVIDVTKYPLAAQLREEESKRRLGLGVSGLADMLAQLGLVYGSKEAIKAVDEVMKLIADSAYMSSARLADERGTFPLWDADNFNRTFVERLSPKTQEAVNKHGLRNGVILTIAPTGTTSMVFGNISSGLEPNFAHSYNRKIFPSNSESEAEQYEEVCSYVWSLFRKHHEGKVKGAIVPTAAWIPDYMITAQDLDIQAHLDTQATCQKWIDASISKTINLPTEISFEDFTAVYMQAYDMGCKGCTTYRPNPDSGRGSVLSLSDDATPAAEEVVVSDLRERPEMLQGITYKVKWPSMSSAIYITINHDEVGQPFELFLISKDAQHQEWMTALTLMISAVMRRGGDLGFIPEELMSITSVGDGAWVEGKFIESLPALIGKTIKAHFQRIGILPVDDESAVIFNPVVQKERDKGEKCPACGEYGMVMSEGCMSCPSCGYAKCG